jgi:hypothetical protein
MLNTGTSQSKSGDFSASGSDAGAIIARYSGVFFWFYKYRWNDREASFRWRWYSLDNNVDWKTGDNENIRAISFPTWGCWERGQSSFYISFS